MNRRACFVLALALVAGACQANVSGETLFDEQADARAELRAAIAEASRSHKNIVLDFGANWCGDCHALEAEMQKPELAALIRKNFVVVNVDVGRFDKNLDLAKKYGVPLEKGIPALAVLDSYGKLIYAQAQGEFERARRLSYQDFVAFFEKWKPKKE